MARMEEKEFRVDRHTDAAMVREHCKKLFEQRNKEGLAEMEKQLMSLHRESQEKLLQQLEIVELYGEACRLEARLSVEQEPYP